MKQRPAAPVNAETRNMCEILNWYFVPKDPNMLKRVRNVARTGEEMRIAFPFEM
jgi:hypothetical protein